MCFVSDALVDRLARVRHPSAVQPMPNGYARMRPVAEQIYVALPPRTVTYGPRERQAGVQHSRPADCARMRPSGADLCAALLSRQVVLFD